MEIGLSYCVFLLHLHMIFTGVGQASRMDYRQEVFSAGLFLLLTCNLLSNRFYLVLLMDIIEIECNVNNA